MPAPGSLQVTNVTPPTELTVEEELLAALLEANEVLVSALRVYEDLERVAIEREAEEISKRDVRIDRSVSASCSSSNFELPFLILLDSNSSTTNMVPRISSLHLAAMRRPPLVRPRRGQS